MQRPFVTENTKERERLISLVGRLTDEALSLPLENDWTIAVCPCASIILGSAITVSDAQMEG